METLELIVQPSAVTQPTDLTHLYESCFPVVAKFISRQSGSFQDAKDIFHDALVIYLEKTDHIDFNTRISPEAYLVGIAKHLWLRKFGKDRKNFSTDENIQELSIPIDFSPTINENRLLSLLERSGEKCLSLLRSFYFEKCSINELKRRFGFTSEHSASVQKYKCIEKIRETIKQKSIAYEDFFE